MAHVCCHRPLDLEHLVSISIPASVHSATHKHWQVPASGSGTKLHSVCSPPVALIKASMGFRIMQGLDLTLIPSTILFTKL